MSVASENLTSREELIREWLLKADNDARSAKALAEISPPILDTAGYHCQQAAEKALKGLMLFHGLPLVKTHDLTLLVQILSETEPKILPYILGAEYLNPFGTFFRYPAGGGAHTPTPDEFRQAYNCAMDIVKFVLSALPPHIRP